MAEEKEKKVRKRTLLQKIVNVFLYTGIILLIFILIFLGFSQTSTFREYLRTTVCNLANKELNGHLSIGRIDGTIFSSLVLRNTVVSMGQDTLLNAGIIEVKASPLQIFLKKIYIRKIAVSNTKISLVTDSSGTLNISRLFPPTPKDSIHSKFPFKIVAPDIELKDIDFSLRDYNLHQNSSTYDYLNMHDFKIRKLNLSASAVADIGENSYALDINNFSFNPNLEDFKLEKLSGEFYIDTNEVNINNLKILTGGSDITITTKISNFNIFDSTAFSKLNQARISADMNAKKFDFDDLSSFVPATSMLKGTASLNLKANGTLKDLTYNELELNYLDTHLESKGKITDLMNAGKMYITANFFESRIRESDAAKLLPSIGIPVIKNLDVVNFDTLVYEGNPLNFKTRAFLRSGGGSADINGSLDLRQQDMIYDLNLITRNLNLSPLTGLSTIFNSKLSIKGSGTSPSRLKAFVKFNGDGSSFEGNTLDSLRFFANADSEKINCSLLLKSNFADADLISNFNFSNKGKPSYKIKGSFGRLNLAEFTHDSTAKSNLNFSLDGSGSNFDPDKLNLYLTLDLGKSEIHGVNIDSARAIADIRSNDNGERVINLISDLADITITGNFSTAHTINLLAKEAGYVSGAVNDKINQILYPDSLFNRQVTNGLAVLNKTASKAKIVKMVYPATNLKYYIEFKNFDLLSLLLGSGKISLNGDMSGVINDTSGNVFISSNTNMDYFRYLGKNNIFLLSNLNLNLNVSNNVDSIYLKDITANLSASSDRIYAGKDFKNLNLNLNLKNDIANIDFYGKMEDNLTSNLSGKFDLTDNSVQLDLDTLKILYNNFLLSNKGNVRINYSKDNISINNFDLARNGGEINLRGTLSRYGSQDLKVSMSRIRAYDLTTNLFNLGKETSLDGNIHLNAEITGDFTDPLAKVNFGVDSIKFKDKNIGMILGSMNYADKDLNVDVRFLDSLINRNKPKLLLSGDIPIDLAFTGVEERFAKDKQINLSLKANDFDLSPVGNAFPKIENLTGDVAASLNLTGTPEDLIPSGTLSIQNSSFLLTPNNIEYSSGIKLSINNNTITIDSLMLANIPGTKNGGAITGTGSVGLKNFSIASVLVNLNGSLKVLSEDSKAVSPSIYGDLVIQTDGSIVYTMSNETSFLKAPIIVKEAKLTFPPTQSAYQSSSNNFVYRYVSNGSSNVSTEEDFERLIRQSAEKNSNRSASVPALNSLFNYSVNVQVQNEAKLKFVLSRELNQNLTANLNGNIKYENIGGKTNVQGELSLLDGSTLEFLKTFEASGTIRFESDLSNPFLNITATYRNYYTPPDAGGQEEPVEVKIKLNGLLKDLSTSFLQDKNNISVYVGSDNINNNKSDPTKTINDAVMFILTGKFSTDMSQQQQSQAINQSGSFASSTATSLAGSLLGMVAQKISGGYVSNVELRNVGSTTKFNLVGKVNKFRYTIGGSTEVFQDLSQVNMQIEYPLLQNLLLRYERKEAINQTSTITNDMINEIGLKYRFEF